jgi:hypothetical protein
MSALKHKFNVTHTEFFSCTKRSLSHKDQFAQGITGYL